MRDPGNEVEICICLQTSCQLNIFKFTGIVYTKKLISKCIIYMHCYKLEARILADISNCVLVYRKLLRATTNYGATSPRQGGE